MKLALDICGWTGMILVVTGYYLVSNGKIEGQTIIFQLINIVAATFIGINAYYYGALPSVGLNVVWVLIGIMAMIKINSNKKNNDN
ncbi:MAG: hypothetical protein AB8D52_09175 [Gammaproteobacteria bacterium]